MVKVRLAEWFEEYHSHSVPLPLWAMAIEELTFALEWWDDPDSAAGGNEWQMQGPAPEVYVRFISQSPAVIAANTPFVNIVGQITNYDFQPGCQITFYLPATLRPNNL